MSGGSYCGGSTVIGPYSKSWFSKSKGDEEPLPRELLEQIEAKRLERKAEKKRARATAKRARKRNARESAEEKAARDRAKEAAKNVIVEVRKSRKTGGGVVKEFDV